MGCISQTTAPRDQGLEQKMTKTFEIIRTDINKRVVPAMEYTDEKAALGEYISALMLVGILPMGSKGLEVDLIAGSEYRLSNGWKVEVRSV